MHVTLSSRYWTERSLGLEFGQIDVTIYYYTPKLPFFKISVYLPAFLYNFHTYNIIYFSHQMIKVIWEKFGLLRLHALSKLVGGGGGGGAEEIF